MVSIRKRVALDVVLTIMLVLEMLYQLTGNMFHEIAGALFLACIIVHIGIAARWIGRAASALSKGELAARQRRLFAVAVLLALDVVVLAVSSVIISQTLWDAGVDLTAFNPGNIWYPLHTASAYVLCILVLGHLAMHWVTVADALKVPYDQSRRDAVSSALNGVVMIGGIALGITGALRAGFQASDFAVNAEGEEEERQTVQQGYREVNAQTGEYTSEHSFETTAITGENGESLPVDEDTQEDELTICPICPRRCKLTAPRCERPYEAGLI